jgi:MarR family transcriptional regulator, 2-MHQ and catechol-resistance regulon repressor
MGTHYRGSPDEMLALDTFVKLSRALQTLGARLAAPLSAAGLTGRQLAVLEALLHRGPMCQRELGRKLLRSDPNMTAVLDTLERDGLVGRERSASDRRMVQVSLTDEGRRVIERVFPGHAQRIAQALAVLAPEEQRQLGALCRKLGLLNARERGAQAPSKSGPDGRPHPAGLASRQIPPPGQGPRGEGI